MEVSEVVSQLLPAAQDAVADGADPFFEVDALVACPRHLFVAGERTDRSGACTQRSWWRLLEVHGSGSASASRCIWADRLWALFQRARRYRKILGGCPC